METKDKILQTALRLYNESGYSAVTTRHIAVSMGISVGNLHYHFKHSDGIATELFRQLIGAFDKLIDLLKNSDSQGVNITDVFDRSFQIMYQYRFIFLNFAEIAQRIPAIKKQYKAINNKRQKEFKWVFKNYQTKGIFRKDISDEMLDLLVMNTFILADFWQSHNVLNLELKGKNAMKQYHKNLYALYFPYLTKSGILYFSNENG